MCENSFTVSILVHSLPFRLCFAASRCLSLLLAEWIGKVRLGFKLVDPMVWALFSFFHTHTLLLQYEVFWSCDRFVICFKKIQKLLRRRKCIFTFLCVLLVLLILRLIVFCVQLLLRLDWCCWCNSLVSLLLLHHPVFIKFSSCPFTFVHISWLVFRWNKIRNVWRRKKKKKTKQNCTKGIKENEEQCKSIHKQTYIQLVGGKGTKSKQQQLENKEI